MEFCEFAQRMHKIIGGADNTAAFVKTLFENILLEKNYSVLEEVSVDTYKAYYNGNTRITRFAKKLNIYLEPECFISYCDYFEDSSRENICRQFKDVIPDITQHNVSEKLAYFFQAIILEAAGRKRKSSTRQTKGNMEYFDGEAVDDETISGHADKDKKITVIQHQTNVLQNGEKNMNLTNNGTININF